MSDDDDRTARNRKLAPWVIIGLAVITYVLIKGEGHSSSTAALVSMIMLAFGGFIMLVHRTLGSKDGSILIFSLAAILFLAQYFGWV